MKPSRKPKHRHAHSTDRATAPVSRPLWPEIDRPVHLTAIELLFAVTILAFANTFHDTQFVVDNKGIILEDIRLREVSLDNLRQIFSQDYWSSQEVVTGLYRPLTTLSYLFNYAVLGSADHAASYHVINFLLHWANAVLVYLVALLILRNFWPALFTAAIFAVHPIVTESVTNIVGRADILASLSVLGALLCYAKSTVEVGSRKLLWLLAMMLIAILGVFSKESAVVVLGVIALYDFTFRLQQRHPNQFKNLALNFGQFFIAGYIFLLPSILLFAWVRSNVFAGKQLPELPFLDNPLVEANFLSARLTALKVIGRYLGLLVWPQTLSCDYSYNQIPVVTSNLGSFENWKALFALAAVLALIALAIWQIRRNKAIFFWILFFFGTLLPTANLLPNPTYGASLTDPRAWCIGTIMAERFLYLPSIAFAGFLAILVYAICQKRIAPIVLGTAILLLGTRTFIRNQDWETDEKLWAQATKACPNSFKTYHSLAVALWDQDLKEHKNIDQVIEVAEKAAHITDRSPFVYAMLGRYYATKGESLGLGAPDRSLTPTQETFEWYQRAADALNRAARLDQAASRRSLERERLRGNNTAQFVETGDKEIYQDLGLMNLLLGRYPQALETYLHLQRIAPEDHVTYTRLASVYLATNQPEPAAVSLMQAFLLEKDNEPIVMSHLAEIYQQLGLKEDAFVHPPGSTSSAPSLASLNTKLPLIRQHICAAYGGLIRVFKQTKHSELARQIRQNALDSGYQPNEQELNIP